MADPTPQIDDKALQFNESVTSTWRWLSQFDERTLIGVGVGVAVVFALLFLRVALRAAVRRIPKKLDDGHSWSAILNRILGRFGLTFFMAVGFAAAAETAQAPDIVRGFAHTLLLITGVFQFAGVVQEASLSTLHRNAMRGASRDKSGLANALGVLKWFVNVAIWSVATLMVLSNLGFNVTGLVAGLGVGGIAIGLAAQDLFKDLFAALAILLDQPFKRGDFISSGDRILGTVEEIGMKTTRIRALSGEEVVLTNSNLLALTLQNYGRMARRRVVVQLGVTYQTPAAKLKRAVEILKEAVESQDKATFDRAHFMRYGASSLDFELVFFVEAPEYNTFMDVQQDILLKIFERFEEEGLSFAYPTRTVHLAAPSGEGVDLRELAASSRPA